VVLTQFTLNMQIFKLMRLCGFSAPLLLLPMSAAHAVSTSTTPGSEFFTVNTLEMIVDITIDDTSLGISGLDGFYDSNDDSEGLLTAELTFSGGLGSSGVSVANNPNGPLVEVEGLSQGNYVLSDPKEIQISSVTTVDFELQYNDGGEGAQVEASAVICLMPIRLSLTEGEAGSNPASASYGYSLEIDGTPVFASSLRLSQTPTGALQLTALEGALRTDGVFFETGDTKGFDFPAITLERSMGIFDDGELLEGRIAFSAITEAPYNNWGAYAGAQSALDNQNSFVPRLGASVPEPHSALLFISGLFALLTRRKRLLK
jgi:hypothetical protein